MECCEIGFHDVIGRSNVHIIVLQATQKFQNMADLNEYVLDPIYF